MTGFEPVALERPGFTSRLLGRKVKDNAYREIQNLLAEASGIASVEPAVVADLLRSYDIPSAEAKPRLRELYAVALRVAAQDLDITDDEEHELRRLRDVLGLAHEDVKQLEIDALSAPYRQELRSAVGDRVYDQDERARMESLAKRLRLPDDAVTDIRREEGGAILQRLLDQAIEDRRLSPEEEGQFQALARDLDIQVTHDEATKRALDRYRLLWRIEQGDLPVCDTPVHLKRGEQCHAAVSATHAEIRTVTRRINYSGFTTRVRIMKGMYWRAGSIAPTRITQDVLTDLDTGTLYVTNKRLLFDGERGNRTFQLSTITNFTVYTNAVAIERDRGKDQIFKWESADSELFGAILGSVIALDRDR